MKHDFKTIEPKWQKKWEDSKIFNAVDYSDKPKFYGLVEFPYRLSMLEYACRTY